MSNRAHAPFKKSPNAPLDSLIERALRRYGSFSSSSIDGDYRLLMLDFANKVIDDIRQHPYFDPTLIPIDYYIATAEVRQVPDEIIVAGMMYYYAMQQESTKIKMYGPEYFRAMNSILYDIKYGNGIISQGEMDGPNGGVAS